MAKQKYYAVRKGRKTGIYTTWPATQKQINGFSGAQYKSFPTEAEAKAYLQGSVATKKVSQTDQTDSGIILYTDGGSRNTGNVKNGHVKTTDVAAWAFLLKTPDAEFSGSNGEFGATNNRMEIMALIEGLKSVKEQLGTEQPVLIISDSKYVLNAINQHWLQGWQRRGWKKSDGSVVINKELWQQVSALLPEFKHLEFKWTKGHADNAGNVYVDELLNQTMDQLQHQPVKTKSVVKPAIQSQNTEQKKSMDAENNQSVRDLTESFKQLGLFQDD